MSNDAEKCADDIIDEHQAEIVRLKQLLIDAQSLIHAPSGNPFEYKLKYDAFQVKLKQEGIK
jgi:hypothetical protein